MRCSRCQSDNDEAAVRCGTCGATLARTSSLPSAPSGERAMPERREATLLFADLGGYTELNQQADIEEVATLMEAIKDGAAEIVQTYGGVVNQFVGDEVMAVFGFPHGHEDDPRRAVSAALELHAFMRSPRIARLSRRRALTFHTGIETGLVLAQSRDLRDGLFDLTGSTVNLAARLRSAATQDEILLGPVTQRHVAGFFRTEALAPRVLKGIAGELTPYRVQAPRPLRSSFDLALERGLTPYVGRLSELATLEGYLAEAGRGEARLVSVMGPAGVGKTRLLHELVRRARERGFTVLRGQCQSYGTIPPFQPFLETLEDAVGLRQAAGEEAPPRSAGALPPADGHAGSDGESPTAVSAARVIENALAVDPALAAHLPVFLYLLSLRDPAYPLPPNMHGQSLRRAVIDGLAQLLVAHAQRRPVLVVVEDWHWADEASDTLFVELARRTVGHPIMAVVTYRSDQLEVSRRPISNRQLNLGHFDEAGTAALLRELLHVERLPDGLAGSVQEIADGNPFFTEEVAHALVESGVLVRSSVQDDSGWSLSRPLSQLGVPHGVQATVRARIDRLVREDKELLKLASVIGAEFSRDLLEPLCENQAGLSPALDRLQQRAHILPSSAASYRFKHPIVHDVVYDILLLQRRRELHGLIAAAIEGSAGERGLEPKYEALAHHYGRSELRERAVHYAELAGRKAERSFSLEQARRQYQAALEHLDELDPTDANMAQRVEISLRWAAALVHNPAPGQVQVLQRSLEYALRLGDARSAARCHSWMGWFEYTLGNLQQSIASNRRGLELCESLAFNDPALRWQLQTNIGVSLAMAARHVEAEAELGPALAFYSPALPENAHATGGYAFAHMALLRADQGDFAASDAAFEQARSAVHRSGQYALVGAITTIEGMTRAFAGDWDGCARCAARVREVAERIEGAFQRLMAAALEGLYLVHGAGDARGIATLRGAALGLESRGVGLALSWCFASLAEALALRAQPEEAITHAETALARAHSWDALGEATALRARALARHQLGALDAAREDIAASLAAARAKGSRREQLITALHWAEQSGERDFEPAALALELDALHMPWYAARARRLAQRDS